MARDSGRTAVQTYVSDHQDSLWRDEAEELGMSRAEYVRTMVQAGRRELGLDGSADRENETRTPGVQGENRGSGAVTEPWRDRVLAIVDAEGPIDWDELVAAVTDDLEDRLEETTDELEDAGRIDYAARHGGFVRTDGE